MNPRNQPPRYIGRGSGQPLKVDWLRFLTVCAVALGILMLAMEIQP